MSHLPLLVKWTAKKLESFGRVVSVISSKGSSLSLGKNLVEFLSSATHSRVFSFRAKRASGELAQVLRSAGIELHELRFYDNLPRYTAPELSAKIGGLLKDIDYTELGVLLSSSEMVRIWVAAMGELVPATTAFAIGRETEEVCRGAGFGEVFVPEKPAYDRLWRMAIDWQGGGIES